MGLGPSDPGVLSIGGCRGRVIRRGFGEGFRRHLKPVGAGPFPVPLGPGVEVRAHLGSLGWDRLRATRARLRLARARLAQAQGIIGSRRGMNVNHISWRRHEHTQRCPRGADRFRTLHFDLDDVVDSVLPRALKDLAHNTVDGEHGLVSRGRRSILCSGATGLAGEAGRDEDPCQPESGSDHDALLWS